MTAHLPAIDFTSYPMPRGPWIRGDAVTIEEHPGPDAAWSLYKLPGGTVAVLSPSPERLASGMLALIGLWRAVANLTRVCPACAARVRMGPSTDGGPATGTMTHENRCVLSDGAITASYDELAGGSPLPADLPSAPRQWTVCPPRLAVRPKRKRRR